MWIVNIFRTCFYGALFIRYWCAQRRYKLCIHLLINLFIFLGDVFVFSCANKYSLIIFDGARIVERAIHSILKFRLILIILLSLASYHKLGTSFVAPILYSGVPLYYRENNDSDEPFATLPNCLFPFAPTRVIRVLLACQKKYRSCLEVTYYAMSPDN